MKGIENCTVMKLVILQSSSPIKVHFKLLEVFNEFIPSFSDVKNRIADVTHVHTPLEDYSREGRSKMRTRVENVEKIRSIFLGD